MELKVIINPIAGAGPAKRLLSNLFYGCGYNFYRSENEFQEDDELIRDKLRQLLRDARAHLSSLEAAFRREHRALTGGDYTFPAAPVVAIARALLHAQRDLEAMEAAIGAPPAPHLHHWHRHHRQERSTLLRLVVLDGEVLLALLTLRDAIARLENGAAAAARMAGLLQASDFDALWTRREDLLSGGSG
ncbi:MAG TPA: hypothetical protein VMD06_02735 [Steroidobacteraceae bacterium]|nr:hypothetical protein [Steroidobacteraceae bacterium]